MLFTDEASFTVTSDSGHQLVYKERVIRFTLHNVQKRMIRNIINIARHDDVGMHYALWQNTVLTYLMKYRYIAALIEIYYSGSYSPFQGFGRSRYFDYG